MRRRDGFTLIEILISLVILATLLGITYRGVISFMELRQQQDVVTATQAKLRRVIEVLTQDLRSSVFGAIIDEPYPSSDGAVSFALLKGNSGFKVYATDPVTWKDAYRTFVIADNPGVRKGDHILIVNQDQKAVILEVSGVRRVGSQKWVIRHNSCRNTLDYRSNTLLFGVDLYGVRHDADRQTLVLNEEGDETPLAFGIREFKVEYLPNKSSAQRLRVTVSAAGEYRGRTLRRRYVGVVELNNNATFDIQEVIPCKP